MNLDWRLEDGAIVAEHPRGHTFYSIAPDATGEAWVARIRGPICTMYCGTLPECIRYCELA